MHLGKVVQYERHEHDIGLESTAEVSIEYELLTARPTWTPSVDDLQLRMILLQEAF